MSTLDVTVSSREEAVTEGNQAAYRTELRVAVMPFEDERPPEERDVEVRKLQGDLRYPYYTYDKGRGIVPFGCGFMGLCAAVSPRSIQIAEDVSQRLAERLSAARLFAGVRFLPDVSPAASSEELASLAGEDLDAVLTGKLTRLYGLSYPVFTGSHYTVFTGTVEYPRRRKIAALVHLEGLQLVSLETREVLWSGGADAAIDREDGKTSAREAADEVLETAIYKIIKQIMQLDRWE